jgi:TBC1 domain family member 13
MTRILYVYAKLNPQILYVQGMNEILAPIFYLTNSSRQKSSAIDEAACFYMFNNAISDIIELHIKDLDKA